MRILHAPENIGGMAGVLARAQRAMGADAWSYSDQPNHFQYPADYTASSISERLSNAVTFSRQFDIFHFYFGRSLLGASLLDVRPLALLGKKIFFSFCGCDIRDEKATTHNYSVSACANCFPKLCSPNREHARAAAERFGRVNFVSTPDLLEFLPRAVLLPQAVDFELVDQIRREPAPRRDPNRFVIVHAPTNRQIKGTRYLLDAVTRLQELHYPVELSLIEKRSHAEALRLYRAADVAVDQLLVGSYGLFAAEMMALGVPTIAYLRPDLRPQYAEAPPLIDAGPMTLEGVLRDCLEGRQDLGPLRAAGEAFARRVHHPEILARRCLDAYAA